MIHTGDCVEVMAGMEPESVDAIVTDPPYGLEFMGKEWDRLAGDWNHDEGRGEHAKATGRPSGRRGWDGMGARPRYHAGTPMQEFHSRWAEAAYRVAKPSAYLLAFGGTRTVHRLTCALEDAGWIIRDVLVWGYASGFPKSKASLKPAWEPIVMARKPGPLRELAIDACRIGVRDESQMYVQPRPTTDRDGASWSKGEHVPFHYGESGGRWPANLILTDPIFDGGWEGVVGGGETAGAHGGYGEFIQHTWVRAEHLRGLKGKTDEEIAEMRRDALTQQAIERDGGGTYSRFFLIPKADRADREPVLGGLPERPFAQSSGARAALARGETEYQGADASTGLNRVKQRANVHPTVKPTDLMRHLVRLVTPAGGTVLDCFAGSGSTLIAAEQEGFAWVGIEKEAEYVAIAEARLNGTQRGLGLETA